MDSTAGSSSRSARWYTVAEANAMLPEVQTMLQQLREAVAALYVLRKRLGDGDELEHPSSDTWVDPDHFQAVTRFHGAAGAFQTQDIEVKDVQRGLIDFPARLGNDEIRLCWVEGEEAIGWYHDLESGFAGRKPIADLPPDVVGE